MPIFWAGLIVLKFIVESGFVTKAYELFIHLIIFLIFIFTLFFFTILYWFCHTLTWIHQWVYMSSQTWTPLPPPTPYHLSGLSPCISPKHPVSYIKHRLAIRFLHDIIYVSMPFSQIILLSPSPSESKSLFLFLIDFSIVVLLNYWVCGTVYSCVDFK